MSIYHTSKFTLSNLWQWEGDVSAWWPFCGLICDTHYVLLPHIYSCMPWDKHLKNAWKTWKNGMISTHKLHPFKKVNNSIVVFTCAQLFLSLWNTILWKPPLHVTFISFFLVSVYLHQGVCVTHGSWRICAAHPIMYVMKDSSCMPHTVCVTQVPSNICCALFVLTFTVHMNNFSYVSCTQLKHFHLQNAPLIPSRWRIFRSPFSCPNSSSL